MIGFIPGFLFGLGLTLGEEDKDWDFLELFDHEEEDREEED